MKHITLGTFHLLLLTCFLLLTSSVCFAADDIRTERVHFKKGANTAFVEGSIKGYGTVDYVLSAHAGQYMNVSLASQHGATYFNILAPGQNEGAMFNGSVSQNQYEGTVPSSGDYRIRVYMMRSAASRNEVAQYRLEMIVDGEAATETHTPPPETVSPTPQTSVDLKPALQRAIIQFMQAEKVPTDGGGQPFFAGFVDLNGDGTMDAIVVLTGSSWCGTGGCTMLVFQGADNGFQFVSRSTLVRTPVTVSEIKTNAWRDLVLTVSGGGTPPRTVALKFDGKQYPPNPSVQAALPAGAATKGTVLFPEGTNPETLAGLAPRKDLKSYDEPAMAIATKYPDAMTVEGICSGEGCGYFFKFKPHDTALDQSEVHLFLPAGARTAADAAIGLESLMQGNAWKKAETATHASEFNYPWVKKIVPFRAEQGMTGYVLIGEIHGQGVRATLLYPAELYDTFLPAAKVVLDNLQFKRHKLPITTQE
jgi:hypothetical protein